MTDSPLVPILNIVVYRWLIYDIIQHIGNACDDFNIFKAYNLLFFIHWTQYIFPKLPSPIKLIILKTDMCC